MDSPSPATRPQIAPSLLFFAAFYGGMVTIAGVLGAKQVALGPLAVEAGIFPFLTLVAISSAMAELHGKWVADRLVRFGFAPLIAAVLLSLFVLALPMDLAMYPPARAAFPIIIGQSWRMQGAGVISYGVSVTLNVWIFSKLAGGGRFAALRGAVAAMLSQIIDTLLFITISFLGVRPILPLMAGQMLAKLVLSALLVPLLITLVVRIGRWLDAGRLDGRGAGQ